MAFKCLNLLLFTVILMIKKNLLQQGLTSKCLIVTTFIPFKLFDIHEHNQ